MVTVQEKGPDFEFSGTPGSRKVLFRILGILLSYGRPIYGKPDFHGGRTFSSSQILRSYGKVYQ